MDWLQEGLSRDSLGELCRIRHRLLDGMGRHVSVLTRLMRLDNVYASSRAQDLRESSK